MSKDEVVVTQNVVKDKVSGVEVGPLLALQDDLDAAGPWVKYVGPATLRIMDRSAWANAGVHSDQYVEWNYLNNMKVPVKKFDDFELDYLLKRDGRFIKVD